jgi:hypothetical protein
VYVAELEKLGGGAGYAGCKVALAVSTATTNRVTTIVSLCKLHHLLFYHVAAAGSFLAPKIVRADSHT